MSAAQPPIARQVISAATYAAAVFLFDIATPLGVAAGVLYVVLVLMGLSFARPGAILVLAGIATVLTVAGYFVSPAAVSDLWVVIANRTIALVAIWSVALVACKRRAAERELADSRAWLHLADDAASIARWDWDPVTRCARVAGKASIFGPLPEGALLTPEVFYARIHPEDRDAVRRAWRRFLADPKGTYDVEYRWVWPDGSTHYHACVGRAIRDEGGAVLRVLGANVEVTAIHAAQARLREVDKLAATGRMAASIAHEINNPLAGIKNAFLLLRDAVPEDHRYHRYVDLVDREINRITEIVRQMYELYRPVETVTASCDVNRAVGDVIALLESKCRARDIRVQWTPVSGQLLVQSVRNGALRQILLNLLQNAVEASPQGGTVRLAAEQRDDEVVVTVSDEGPGIPPAIAERVWEPFFSTKQGLGLGLPISQSLAAASGGTLTMESRPGTGTTARLVLPVLGPRPAGRALADRPPPDDVT